MSDRELLELAAKAAGIEIHAGSPWHGYNKTEGFYRLCGDGSQVEWQWNPLTDDGDALRLAVKLRLSLHVWDTDYLDAASAAKSGKEGEDPDQDDWHFVEAHSCGDDLYAATRRAIVRAAAEIGRTL